MSEHDPHLDVDPDPFTIAALSISAAALVLQLIQTRNSFPTSQPRSNNFPSANETQILGQLDEATENLNSQLRMLNRTIERGSANSEAQFYDAPFRVTTTSLQLQAPNHTQLQQQLGTAYGRLGNLSMWINHVIRENPQLASRLGSRISGGLAGTAEVLNRAMAKGESNRVIISEGRIALEELAKAIEAELANGN